MPGGNVGKAEPLYPSQGAGWTTVPASGRDRPAPEPPEGHGLSAAGWARWFELWESEPVAVLWGASEGHMVARMLRLEELVRGASEPKGTWLTELRHIETALGIGPRARRELRIRVAEPERPGAALERLEEIRDRASRRERLMVTDPPAPKRNGHR